MRKSELIRQLQDYDGDPEVMIVDRHMDAVAREAQIVDEICVAPDAAFSRDSYVFWEKGDQDIPATYPGDDPGDPVPVIALVLR